MQAIASRSTLASVLFAWLAVFCVANEESVETDSKSGLRKDAEQSWMLVKNNCGSCHSGRLLTQHRLDRTNWLKAIRRMQSEEGLWDLGVAEPKILDYLSTFYGTSGKPESHRVRRAQLKQVDTTRSSKSKPQSSSNERESITIDADSTDSSKSQSVDEEEALEN